MNQIINQLLLISYNTQEIRHAYKSKYYLKRKNQAILLIITDGKKWHYLAVKKISTFVRGTTWKHEGDFYRLNWFHSYSIKDRLKKDKDVCENHDYYYIEIPKENNKSIKIQPWRETCESFTYHLESLFGKMNTCDNNPKNSWTSKINKRTTSGYSLFTNCSFDPTKNKLVCYRGKDCVKNVCIDLRENARKIVNYEKKEIIPLAVTIENKKYVIYAKNNLVTDENNRNIVKSQIIVITLENI